MDWSRIATLLLGVGMLAGMAGAGDGTAMTGTSGAGPDPDAAAAQDTPIVVMKTSLGTIVLELYPEEAPVTVANFLAYVEKGFYSGLIFHRVIPGFVVQGGGLTKSLRKRSTLPPIVNESDNGLSNKRGTIAMARESDPNSARSQFYINLRDNSSLDFKGPRPDDWGYTVFGRVREGLDVAEQISRVETGVVAGMADVPLQTIMIRSMRLQKD